MIQKERLLKLADFLDALPEERFDFGVWSQWTNTEEGHCNEVNLHKCETVACALGWATAIPEFRELGLGLIGGVPSIGTRCDSEFASATIFGLDSRDHDYLFIPGGNGSDLDEHATAKQVAQHIRDFVADRT